MSDGGHSWTRVRIGDAPTLFDGKVLNFKVDTPEGEKTAKVILAGNCALYLLLQSSHFEEDN